MKFCIVTVYNSINSGSYWQARVLGLQLEKKGHEVFYLKIKNEKIYKRIIYITKKLIKRGISTAQKEILSYIAFRKALKDFKTIPNDEKYFSEIDCFILGSDTIWNLESKYFEKNINIFFGNRFKNHKVISYAASIANTKISKIKEHNEIISMLNQINSISVRDEYSLETLTSLIQKKIDLVCDPTLLFNKEDYFEFVKKPIENKYIFLYLFADLSEKQNNELKKFALENNLKIISGVTYMSASDKLVSNSPYTFLNYMYYADFIITDTFHGTIFSTNLEKKFVVINKNKQKVNDFLKRFTLENRLLNSNESLINKFDEKINYENIQKKLTEIREQSLKFLETSLNRGECDEK